MKKSIFTLLAILAVTLLPGCGKSGGSGVVAGSIVGATGSNATLNGQCYDILSLYTANAGFTGVFGGYASYADAYNVIGTMYGAAITMPGVNYSRTNVAGDSIQIGYSGNQLYGYVVLAPATVQALAYKGFRYFCGLQVNSAVSGGIMANSVYIYGSTGYGMTFTGLSI